MDRYDVGALILYVLLTLAITMPLPLHMNEFLPGSSSDVYINPWANWWTREALVSGLDFYHTDYMFYPNGTSLVFHSFSHANTAISLALEPFLGQFVAYNSTILLAYALSGFSAYLLVRHLTGCRPAAVVSGLVFAFSSYHISESDHPVLVTTQWIPLFALALNRLLYHADQSRVKQLLLAALWFLLTALSSLHLMLMLGVWTALYLFYGLVFQRERLVPGIWRYLVLLGVIVGLALAPLLYPIASEYLTSDISYMAVQTDVGLGNDLLSFVTPNRRHPLFAPLVASTNDQIGAARKHPGYLGFLAVGLAISGVVVTGRKARFWWISGLLFLIVSLGARVMFLGEPLHIFPLPWAIPVISVMRHPFRFNVLLFFSLSVLVGLGGHSLVNALGKRSKWLSRLTLFAVGALVLFEYRVDPFPLTQPEYSPFLIELAQEDGEFAVADFPMGRRSAKYYLFYQMLHGRKMVDGVVSRTPDDAYAFVDENPLLRALRAGRAPASDLDIQDQFAILAEQGIPYIIVHKDLLGPSQMEEWREWLMGFPLAFFEDEWLIVYRTTSAPNHYLWDGVGVIDADLSADTVAPDVVLETQVAWGITSVPETRFQTEVSLVDEGGRVAQMQQFRVTPDRTLGQLTGDEIARAGYSMRIDPWLDSGEYTVLLRLVSEEDGQPLGQGIEVGIVTMLAPDRDYIHPDVEHDAQVSFGTPCACSATTLM